ncbi:hypothetical protein M3638_01450 [Oceanobacillus profundus]|uniref:hypothetical protein n=1 Tax=Oceanobacillus profundus TaxID=372463 RepID=UPI00203FCFAD|nr:hypothetical protein [Oceanobacillus profundus]MCM3396500.1 hypothetical protein [Oceanobacillus profundus]
MTFSQNQFKKVIVLMTIILTFIGVSLSPVNAATGVDPQSKEFKEAQNAMLEAIVVQENSIYVDAEKAKGKLTEEQVNEINLYFANMDEEYIKEFANQYHGSNGDVSLMALPAIPLAVKIFLGTLGAFVGWELASNITEDFYNWGVTGACKSWSNIGVIESFCKANDYL